MKNRFVLCSSFKSNHIKNVLLLTLDDIHVLILYMEEYGSKSYVNHLKLMMVYRIIMYFSLIVLYSYVFRFSH